MKITWLCQAGLLFENDDISIIVDPYLSDSCHKVNPLSWRRMPIDGKYLEREYDVLVMTHDHMDHTDPETYPFILGKENPMTVLCPVSSWNRVRNEKGNNNYVMFNRGSVWTEKGITFTAVKAEHSDLDAIGIIIDDGFKKYYVTGDTLYNKDIFSELPDDIYAVFMPINGVGNNMNVTDAVNFAETVGAKYSIPLHYGLFDELTPDGFTVKNRIILEPYKKIEI